MTSIELKDRLTKAEEKVTKCENTIERHMKQLEKRQAKLLRVEWMAQYMEDLKAVMWDEEKRAEYKRATGDDLYWDCCDVQSKEEDIKGAKRKLEDQKEVVSNWREKLAKQVEKELTLANEVPEAFREAMLKSRKELEYKEFRKQYTYTAEESLKHTDDEFRKIEEREADTWLLDLYNRVKEITGEITDCSYIRWGGKCLDGYIVGKNGKASVETIGAGGYNIQRWHLRTLVHKI